MESDLRSNGSHSTRVSTSDRGQNTKPESSEEMFVAESSAQKRSLLQRSLKARSPYLYGKCVRALTYIRGPRPKIDLPNPIPLLDRSYTFRGRTITLAVESAILHWTRLFTSYSLFVIFVIVYIVSSWYLIPASSFVGCTSVFWTDNAGCGLNGELCTPFSNYSFSFRCPAQCSSVVLQNPRIVGDLEIDFAGDSQRTYRADSFLCASAVQATSTGGCATVNLVGQFTDYLPSHSSFPMSYRLTTDSTLGQCTDLRNVALAVNILATCLLFIVFRPKPIMLYWFLVCIGFWHVALFSQPQQEPPPLDVAFGAFLPTLLVGYGLWRVSWRFTLPAFANAPFEAMVWYLAPYWAGPGGLTALVIIVLVVLALVVNQVRVIRKTGWLPWYLGWYVSGGLVALALAFLPGLQFRLHHYIISMALLPGTGFPTRLSAIYQGFLLGMFLNGVAAFGFASILQTAADFVTNSTTYDPSVPLGNQTIFWSSIPSALVTEGWNGFSLLVDDVERYAGNALNYSLAGLDAGLPHFFRLAYTSRGSAGDFTMPADVVA
ncbi:hypothetical protein BKA83DRAFT_4203028 [Pisolithus microcarpus]|nr:hypothetical protein BKA83DRAFT_4203028 [Pisolithus microcarpus]